MPPPSARMTTRRGREDLMLTQSQYEAYCKAQQHCPKCNSTDIASESYEADADWVEFNIKCGECGAEWQDVHDFTDMAGVNVVPDAAVIEMDAYSIVVTHDGLGGATIVSDLPEGAAMSKNPPLLDVATNVIEGMILACACEGIDITTPAFHCAVETIVDKVGNEYG